MDNDENFEKAIRESLEEKLRELKKKFRDEEEYEKEYEELIARSIDEQIKEEYEEELRYQEELEEAESRSVDEQIAKLENDLKHLNRLLAKMEPEEIIVEPVRKKQRIARILEDNNVYYSHNGDRNTLMRINAMECGGEGDCFYYSLAYALNQLGYTVSNSSDEPLISTREIGKIAGKAIVAQMMQVRGLLFNEILKITDDIGLASIEEDPDIIFKKKSPPEVRRRSSEAIQIAKEKLKRIQKGDEKQIREVRNQGNMYRDKWINDYRNTPFQERLRSVAHDHCTKGTYANQPVMSLFIPILNLIGIAGFYVILDRGKTIPKLLFRFEKRDTQQQDSDRFLLFINYQTNIQHYRLGYWRQENENGRLTNNYIFTRRGIFTFLGNPMNIM